MRWLLSKYGCNVARQWPRSPSLWRYSRFDVARRQR